MNLFFIGCESDSGFVVAPIRVKGLIGSLILHHSGITISIKKSSIAIYNTSSIVGLRRWISSIKRISPVSRLLSTLTSSLGLLNAYQVTTFKEVPICLERMPARVVFPNPLDHEKRICPSSPALSFALSMAVLSTALIGSCPTKDSKSTGLWDPETVFCEVVEILLTSIIRKSKVKLCFNYTKIILK